MPAKLSVSDESASPGTRTVLVTTTSFQDTPGPHHELLARAGWTIRTARGPLPEAEMLTLIPGVDGLLCGDDEVTEAVLQAGLPTLKVVSKYGIGVDKIDVDAATRLGLPVCYTPGVNHVTVAEHGVQRMNTMKDVLAIADIVSLHTNLTEETRRMIDAGAIAGMKEGVTVINCARGELVDSVAIADALAARRVGGYGTDVLDTEPPSATHPLLSAPRCIVTPHIASRTYESVVRQATMSVENLVRVLDGREPLAAVNR